MEANIIVVDERRKNRLMISELIQTILPSANVIEALDGNIASLKFDNQKLDLLILNIEIKSKPSIKLIKDVLIQNKMTKENIIVFYEAIDKNQLKSLLELGITDVLSYSADREIIKTKLSGKIASMLKTKSLSLKKAS